MTKHTGEDRREGQKDRRAMRLSAWIGLLVSGGVGAAIGYLGSQPEAVTLPDHTPALDSLSSSLETLSTQISLLALGEPEVRTVLTERLRIDTLRIPYEVAVPQIVRVHDTTEVLVFRVDTLWMPPQIVTIPVPARTFWSPETYKPSIGNTVWSFGGVALGMFLHGVVFPTAKACVIVNIDVMVSRDEMCNF